MVASSPPKDQPEKWEEGPSPKLPAGLEGPWISILESLDSGVGIMKVDAGMKRRTLLWCNDAYVARAGMSRRELLHQTNIDDLQEHLPKEGLRRLYRQVSRKRHFQGVYRWREGTRERWLAYRCVPVELEGSGSCLISFEREVTEEVQSRRRIRLLASRLLESTEEVRRDLARRLESGAKPAADTLYNVLDSLARERGASEGGNDPIRLSLEWAGEVRSSLADLLGETASSSLAGASLASSLRRLCRERRMSLSPSCAFPLRISLDESRLDDLGRRVLYQTAHTVLHGARVCPVQVVLSQGRTLTSLRIGLDKRDVPAPGALQTQLERGGLNELLDLASGRLSVLPKPGLVQVRAVVPVVDVSY